MAGAKGEGNATWIERRLTLPQKRAGLGHEVTRFEKSVEMEQRVGGYSWEAMLPLSRRTMGQNQVIMRHQ